MSRATDQHHFLYVNRIYSTNVRKFGADIRIKAQKRDPKITHLNKVDYTNECLYQSVFIVVFIVTSSFT